MDVKGFFKNVLSPDTETNPAATTGDSNVDPNPKMTSFLSNTSRFLDSMQSKKEGLISDISSKLNSIKLPGDPRRDSTNQTARRSTAEAEEESSASEYGDDGDRPMYAEEAPMERQDSVDSVDSLPEAEAMNLRSDIKELVDCIINEKSIDYSLEEKFSGYQDCHTGRSVFAKQIRLHVSVKKNVSSNGLEQLARMLSVSLRKCNEAEDFKPATQLMQSAFSLYNEIPATNLHDHSVQQYLYSLILDQPIWQSMRFWNAAFFIAIQEERRKQASWPVAQGETLTVNAEEVQNNAAFVQISKFIWRMHALGISKKPCLEFLRKQAMAENLPKEKFRQLYNNFLKFYRAEELDLADPG